MIWFPETHSSNVMCVVSTLPEPTPVLPIPECVLESLPGMLSRRDNHTCKSQSRNVTNNGATWKTKPNQKPETETETKLSLQMQMQLIASTKTRQNKIRHDPARCEERLVVCLVVGLWHRGIGQGLQEGGIQFTIEHNKSE
eukprot:jgi/Psemu1/304072/fgenesh1_kg.133_\